MLPSARRHASPPKARRGVLPFRNVQTPEQSGTLCLRGFPLQSLCAQMQSSMKKFLVLIATVSLVLGACERHPASQLPNESEGVAKEGSTRPGATQEAAGTPEASPSGTPKTYFPQNS